jgi:hypothetical protein
MDFLVIIQLLVLLDIPHFANPTRRSPFVSRCCAFILELRNAGICRFGKKPAIASKKKKKKKPPKCQNGMRARGSELNELKEERKEKERNLTVVAGSGGATKETVTSPTPLAGTRHFQSGTRQGTFTGVAGFKLMMTLATKRHSHVHVH